MLEIIGIIILSNINSANATRRGQNPAVYAVLTIGLWVGMEVLGLFVGLITGLEIGLYFLALSFGLMGGVISYLMSIICKSGSYVTPSQQVLEEITKNPNNLSTPVQLNIIREGSIRGAWVNYKITVNGTPIGKLKNKSTLTIKTNQKKNIICALDSFGSQVPSIVFDVGGSGQVSIYFQAGKFLPMQATGVQNVSILPLLQAAPQKKVNVFSRIFTIFNLVIGVILLLIPMIMILTNDFDITQDLDLLAPFIIGGIVASFSIAAAVSIFGKYTNYRKWLSVIMYVIFGLFSAMVVFTIIAASIN